MCRKEDKQRATATSRVYCSKLLMSKHARLQNGCWLNGRRQGGVVARRKSWRPCRGCLRAWQKKVTRGVAVLSVAYPAMGCARAIVGTALVSQVKTIRRSISFDVGSACRVAAAIKIACQS